MKIEDRITHALDECTGALGDDPPPLRRSPVVSVAARPATRSRRPLFVLGAGVAAALLMVVVGAVVYDRSQDPSQLAASTATITLDLPGAVLSEDSTGSAGNAASTLWASTEGGSYLYTMARPGAARSARQSINLGGADLVPGLPGGEAWLTTRADGLEYRLWWARDDGDLWTLTYTAESQLIRDDAVEALTSWALQMEDGSSLDGLEALYTDDGGNHATKTLVWDLDGYQVTLLLADGSLATGFANILGAGRVEHTSVAGEDALLAAARNGELEVGWHVADTKDTWASLTIPAELAGSSSEILAALRT